MGACHLHGEGCGGREGPGKGEVQSGSSVYGEELCMKCNYEGGQGKGREGLLPKGWDGMRVNYG